MNSNSKGGYRPAPPRFDKRRPDNSRRIMFSAITVIGIAILVFTFLIFAELFGWLEKGKDPLGDPVSYKFNTTEITMTESDVHRGDLILINETYKYVFPDSAISPVSILDTTLRKKHSYTNAAGEVKDAFSYYSQSYNNCAKLELEALKAFIAWTDDFSITNNNIDLFIFDEDGYRTYAEQEALYAKKPTAYSTAGASEHHTGKVIDIYGQVSSSDPIHKIDDTVYKSRYQWLYDNAYKYGFVLRYPSAKADVTGVGYESYHFRHVGYAHAYYMDRNDLCLEEYLELLKSTYTALNPLEFTGDDGARYMVYYTAAASDGSTTLVVPADYSYTVSGDNMGGFIVTATLDK